MEHTVVQFCYPTLDLTSILMFTIFSELWPSLLISLWFPPTFIRQYIFNTSSLLNWHSFEWVWVQFEFFSTGFMGEICCYWMKILSQIIVERMEWIIIFPEIRKTIWFQCKILNLLDASLEGWPLSPSRGISVEFLVSSLLRSAILSVMLLPCSIIGSMLKPWSFDGISSFLYLISCPLDVKWVSIHLTLWVLC